jgi:hypothetical protein
MPPRIRCAPLPLVVLGVAFPRDGLAHKIIDLAKAGVRDPERLCEGVLQEFRSPPHVYKRAVLIRGVQF